MTRDRQLLDELQRYSPADGPEHAHRDAMVKLLTESREPFSRAHFSPGHVTASCYIIDDDARLLLHHHRRLDRWLQMGGHVDGDEETLAAALREGEEESGLDDLELAHDGIFDLDIHAIPAGKGEPVHLHFDVRYLARTKAPDRIALDAKESKELSWVALDRAESLIDEAAGSRVIRKIRSLT